MIGQGRALVGEQAGQRFGQRVEARLGREFGNLRDRVGIRKFLTARRKPPQEDDDFDQFVARIRHDLGDLVGAEPPVIAAVQGRQLAQQLVERAGSIQQLGHLVVTQPLHQVLQRVGVGAEIGQPVDRFDGQEFEIAENLVGAADEIGVVLRQRQFTRAAAIGELEEESAVERRDGETVARRLETIVQVQRAHPRLPKRLHQFRLHLDRYDELAQRRDDVDEGQAVERTGLQCERAAAAGHGHDHPGCDGPLYEALVRVVHEHGGRSRPDRLVSDGAAETEGLAGLIDDPKLDEVGLRALDPDQVEEPEADERG